MIPKTKMILKEDENAAVITEDGCIYKLFVNEPTDAMKYADAIQECMVTVMKKPESQQGFWLWKIYDDWNAIAGKLIQIRDNGRF